MGIPQLISSPYTYTITSYFTDPLNSGATAPLNGNTAYTITVFAYEAQDVNTYLVNSIDGTGTFQDSGDYQISYNINGGSGITPGNSTYSAGTTNISLNDGSGISRENYSLSGWSLNGSVPGSFTYAGPLNSNITMVAVWTAVSQGPGTTYPLTYTFAGPGVSGTLPSPENLAAGATITLASGAGLSKAGYTFAGWLQMDDSAVPATMPAASLTVKDTWAPIQNTNTNAVCFLGSAPVKTPAGWARIDSLAVGDLVRTADGRDVAIQRVKHQRIERPSAAVNPYVIPAGLFGATENLAISPRHCVAVPGRGMVEAREIGLAQMPMRAAFDYYNLELPEWDNMVVAGVEVESLAPRKRVEMTLAQFAKLVAALPAEKRAGAARRVMAMSGDKVIVEMSRKERKMRA
jgi:hypothetical protein